LTFVTRTYAAATCSWINPSTGLPENDSPVMDKQKPRSFLTGSKGFRYCNFAEVFVDWDTDRKAVVSSGFRAQSGIYRSPSFLNIPSHAFPVERTITRKADCIEFVQVAGARTVTAEVGGTAGGALGGMGVGALLGTFVFPGLGTLAGAALGALIGTPTGEVVAHQVMNFPPIWSKLKIVMFNDGKSSASVVQHSYFPSLTFYEEMPGTAGQQFGISSVSSYTTIYNANNSPEGTRWHDQGWGLSANAVGPSAGNPWGVAKGVTGGGENIPN
jgi:outer membrane lipoprotein SlyB